EVPEVHQEVGPLLRLCDIVVDVVAGGALELPEVPFPRCVVDRREGEDAGGFGYRLERSDRPRLTLRLRFRGRRRDRHDTWRLPYRRRLGAALGDRLGTTGRRGSTRRCCPARLSRSSGA